MVGLQVPRFEMQEGDERHDLIVEHDGRLPAPVHELLGGVNADRAPVRGREPLDVRRELPALECGALDDAFRPRRLAHPVGGLVQARVLRELLGLETKHALGVGVGQVGDDGLRRWLGKGVGTMHDDDAKVGGEGHNLE